MNSRDSLERIDFDDPKVIANIRKAARKPLSKKDRKRLEQFETPVHPSAWQQVFP